MKAYIVKINDEMTKKVVKLARIELPPEKIGTFTPQLESILEYFESINKVNVQGVEPTYQVTGLKSVLREDVVESDRTLTQKQTLVNSPKNKNGYFVIKSISKK